MQTFYPWGKESLGILLNENNLEQLRGLSRYCQSYYYAGVEKRRSGSSEDDLPVELKEEILVILDQICEQIKNLEPWYSVILDNPFMKQSFMAALVAHTLDFDYRILQTAVSNGRIEVRGVIRDNASFKIETTGSSDLFDPADSVQFMAAFHVASKRAFISAVAQLSELELLSKVTEVFI